MKKYENFCKSLKHLKEGAMLNEPYTAVEQVGISGLFNICFEQSWKAMKEILELHGYTERKIGSPRAIIKAAYQFRMINDEELWLNLLEARNLLSHTYNDEQSLALIRDIKANYVHAFEDLKKELLPCGKSRPYGRPDIFPVR